MLKNKLFYNLCVLLMLVGCQQNQVFNANTNLPSKGWHKDSILHFKIPLLDTLQKHHVFFNVRNTNDFPFSNLYVIAQLNFPNGKQQTDTLQYKMAKPNGEWLGHGATSVKESKLWYLENFQFSEKGEYHVAIQHAMRANGNPNGIIYLQGISDVGIQIETVSEQSN